MMANLQTSVSLAQNLVRLSQEAPNVKVRVPPELISYVESARNPDVFTREFVEAVQRMNQGLKGRCEAYLYLRNTLAKDIIAAMPELKDDVARVVATTGDTLTTD
jgi:mediator of RNA polymerase II transcription subunit 10